MSYKVKLHQFEGPFDLLVYLIEHAKMSIYDIKISEITNQYIDYIEEMAEPNVDVASEFMILAASLLEIKSKMLLPRYTDSGNEIESEDPRTELVEKLLEYRKFKNLSEMLGERELYGRSIFTKPKEDLTEYTNEPDEYLVLEIDQFVSAFNQFILKKKKETDIKKRYEQKEKMRITSEAKIEFIKEMFLLDGSKTVDFFDLVKGENDRFDMALTFSSMLELVKKDTIWADQKIQFGDIEIGATESYKELAKKLDKRIVEAKTASTVKVEGEN